MSRAERAELTRKVGENYGVFKQQNQGAAPSQNPYGVMKHKPTAREWADAGKINGKLITLPDGRRVYDRY